MTAPPASRHGDLLLLASPGLFLLHEVEEYHTMLPWIRAHGDVLPELVRARAPDDPSFILLGGALLFAVFVAVAIACIRSGTSRRLWTLFAILVLARLENSVGHMAMTAIFRGYTFGVITAALIVFPLSLLIVRELVLRGVVERASLPRHAVWALGLQALVLGTSFVLNFR